jgi:hypothetical protein
VFDQRPDADQFFRIFSVPTESPRPDDFSRDPMPIGFQRLSAAVD